MYRKGGRTYTAWATGDPPVEGVWRVKRNKDYGSYAYWDGKRWGISQSSPALAYGNRACESLFGDWEWFGLAFNPEPWNG